MSYWEMEKKIESSQEKHKTQNQILLKDRDFRGEKQSINSLSDGSVAERMRLGFNPTMQSRNTAKPTR